MKAILKLVICFVTIAVLSYSANSQVTSVNNFTGTVELRVFLSTDSLFLSNSPKVFLPFGTGDVISINTGTGIDGGGSSQTVTLSANKGNAIWNVNKIQNIRVSNLNPLNGQILKYINNRWSPANDEVAEIIEPLWKTSGTDLYVLNGNVGIGTTNAKEKLTVDGKILATEVRIDSYFPAPDYVFAENYNMMSLEELETFVIKNRHLPEIPSGKEIESEGIKLAFLNMMLLKRIEELTLHIIDQEKRIITIENKNNENK